MGFLATTTSISELLPGYLIGNTTASDTLGTAIFSRHMDRAEGMVMAAMAVFYDTGSFTTTNYPPYMRALAEDITCFFAIRGASTQDGQTQNKNLDEFRPSYDLVQSVLSGEKKDAIPLAYTDGSAVPLKSSVRFLTSTNYTPIFGKDEPEAWARDSDEISDQEASR